MMKVCVFLWLNSGHWKRETWAYGAFRKPMYSAPCGNQKSIYSATRGSDKPMYSARYRSGRQMMSVRWRIGKPMYSARCWNRYILISLIGTRFPFRHFLKIKFQALSEPGCQMDLLRHESDNIRKWKYLRFQIILENVCLLLVGPD